MAVALTRTGAFDEALVSLSKSASMLKSSPALAGVSQGLLVRACREQAAALLELGKARLAADALLLASGVLEAGGAAADAPRAQTERAQLARQLALCFADLRDPSAARERAEEAVRLEVPGSAGHAKSLRALVTALCMPGAGGAGEEVRAAAAAFVGCRRAKPSDCLGVCAELADRGMDAACLACLTALRARLKGSEAEELGSVWLFGAQLLAGRVEELLDLGFITIVIII